MVNEAPTWWEGQRIAWLNWRPTIKDLFENLKKNRKEKKEKMKIESEDSNRKLIDLFQENYWKDFNYEKPISRLEFDRHLMRGDCVLINNKLTEILHDMYSRMFETKWIDYERNEYEINNLRLSPHSGWVSFIVETNELNNFLNHLQLLWYSSALDFSRIKLSEDDIKEIKKFMDREKCCNCYFNVWNISNESLKNLITWFTRKWKSSRIDNSIIEANWKKYHSSWDYRFEFD